MNNRPLVAKLIIWRDIFWSWRKKLIYRIRKRSIVWCRTIYTVVYSIYIYIYIYIYIVYLFIDFNIHFILFYIENNTWMCRNMKFICECWPWHLTSEQSERMRYPVQHKKLISYFQALYCSIYYIPLPHKHRTVNVSW